MSRTDTTGTDTTGAGTAAPPDAADASEPTGGGAPGASAAAPPARAGARRSRLRTALWVVGLTGVVVLPLAVALAALRTPRWFPLLDLAMTELRVRDVGTSHTPLVGLVGRLSSGDDQGSHPGPLSFWSLAPTYRVLGGSAWGLLVSVVVLNTVAVGLSVWAAMRRGGTVVALGFAGGLAVLVHLYGTKVLTEPWNPYMPVMWWALTLIALWAVLCDDLPMLPVAVFAASFCLQTHISYLGLVGGFTALALVAFVVRLVRLRDDRPARRRLLLWSGIAVGFAVVLWLPPIIDQVTGDPGNASIVIDHFQNPDEEPIGIERGAELFAVQLNPWRLAAGQPAISGSVVPGVVLVGVWALGVLLAWRLPRTVAARSTVLRLDLVIAAALVLGFVSATRILGFVWFYLALWAWSITMLLVVATVWTAVLAVRSRAPAERPATGPRPVAIVGVGALAAVLVGWTGWFAVDARDAEPTQAVYSSMLGRFTQATTAAIDAHEVDGGGPDGRYLITWTDGINLGSTGYGLMSELEREGYDAGVASPYGPGTRQHRVMDPTDATAEIHISFGPDIAVWDAKPDVRRIVYVDPRTPEQLATYQRARTQAIEGLRAAGLEDLVPIVDKAPFQLYFDDDLPDDLRGIVQVINDTGQPAAVFVGPPPPARRPAAPAAPPNAAPAEVPATPSS